MRKESEDISKFTCTICREDKQYVAIGVCNHTKVCNYCSLKSRMFYDDDKCPICNTILDTLYVIPIQERGSFSYEYLESQKKFYFKDDDYYSIGVYYQESGAMEEAIKLKSHICPINICISEPFENLNELKKHLKSQHQKTYCDICLKEGKRFLSEQPVYSSEELKLHIEYGDYNEGFFKFPPHPQCPYCKQFYFDVEDLYTHIHYFHFVCEICRIKNKIICYSALPNLVDHYKIKHYRCPYSQCVDNLYIVFENESELITHFLSWHDMILGSDKLNQLVLENKPTAIKNPENWNIALSMDEFNFTFFSEKLKTRAIQHSKTKQTIKEYKGHDVEVEIEEDKGNQYFNRPWKKKIEKNELTKFNQEEDKSNPKTKTKTKLSSPVFINHSFVLQFYIDLIKSYLIGKIQEENIYESEFILSKETIYQLIVIIDKLETNDNIFQLPYLHHFGIELETANKISALLLQGENINEDEFKVMIDQMSIQKILVLYKYLRIAYQKVNDFFFKLDLDQIKEDLYNDFIQKNKNQTNNQNQLNNKNYYKNKKWHMKQNQQYGFQSTEPKKEKGKLHYIFDNKNNESSTISNIQEEKKMSIIKKKIKSKAEEELTIENTQTQESQKKSKLAMLLENSSYNNNKQNKGNKMGKERNFKLSNFNLDKDFPVLK